MSKVGPKKAHDKKERKNTSLRLDEHTLKELEIHAIREDLSVQRVVEKLIEDDLRERRLS